MEPALSQGHSTFRNQPPYTIFNKSFEDPNDILFLQLNDIDPYFLTEVQLKDKSGFLQNDLIDPRTKKELKCAVYNYTKEGRNINIFKRGGVKSTLTKRQQDVCLRVLQGWQDKKEINEGDLILWRQLEGKIKKEREHMHQYIREYAETHKEDIYAPTKRFNEYYRHWFKQKANILLNQHTENLAFNTHTGLPHVSVCKNINDEKADISDVQLIARKGWIRKIAAEDDEINWKNFNFRLDKHVDNFNDALSATVENVFKSKIDAELSNFEEEECSKSCYIPLETILFLLTAGDYIDLPTECLLEISDDITDNHKIIAFDSPFPARNCGWHSQQQVVEQAFFAYNSTTGRSKWLHVENDTVQSELLPPSEIHAISGNIDLFKPVNFERYLANYKACEKPTGTEIKSNSALIKWYLKSSESAESFKILTTISLPPTLDNKAKTFLSCEAIKLEYKPEFGCEYFTKYELLRAWLKMRLMCFSTTTNHALFYRISSIDCDIQLKENLTLNDIEQYLQYNYHVNPAQLMANLAEFLKLLFNMATGKYLLRYNAKYKDKLLLCLPSREITQNTVHLHRLLQAEPTDMLFMTQPQFLPIIETLCSCVHLKHRILPCMFLPKLAHQTNLQTPAAKTKARQLSALKKQDNETSKKQEQMMKGKKRKRSVNKRKNRSAASKLLKEDKTALFV